MTCRKQPVLSRQVARALAAGMLAASLALAPASAFAGIEKAGTTAANFLAVGSGADVLGMGGATLGFGSGLGAAAWNIAALGSLSQTEYVFAHSSLSGASPQDWIAAGGRFGPATRWGLTGLYQGDGSFEGRDVNNLPTGSFSASSLALGVQLAQAVGDVVAVGLGAKYASERLGDVSGGGVTFDAGVRVQAGPVGLGAAAQNAFGKMSYSGASYDFPTSYGVGASYQIPASGLTVALDANMPAAYFNDVRGGLEWRYHDRVALRGGYRKELGAGDGEPLGGPTFGMGAGSNGFWFDYGFLTGGASGSGQHRMSLTYHPGFMNAASAVSVTGKNTRATRDESTKSTKAKPSEKLKSPVADKSKASAKSTATIPAVPNPNALAKPVATAPVAPAPTAVAKPIQASPPNVAPAENSPRTTQAVRTPASPEVAAPAPIKPPVAHPASRFANPSPPVAPAPQKPAAPATATPAPAPVKTPPPAPSKPAVTTPPASVPAPAPSKPAVTTPSVPMPTAPSAPKPAPPAVESAPQKTAPAPAETAPAKAPVEEKPAPPKAATEEKPAPPPVAAPAPPREEPKPAPPPAPAKAEPRPAKIKVKSGETLADIAKRWNTSVPALMMENDLVSEQVKSGQTLKLPPPR